MTFPRFPFELDRPAPPAGVISAERSRILSIRNEVLAVLAVGALIVGCFSYFFSSPDDSALGLTIFFFICVVQAISVYAVTCILLEHLAPAKTARVAELAGALDSGPVPTAVTDYRSGCSRLACRDLVDGEVGMLLREIRRFRSDSPPSRLDGAS